MQDGSKPKLIPLSVGLLEYRRCLALQEALHACVVAETDTAYLLFVEHPSVLTLGKHADPKYMKDGAQSFAARGIDVVAIDRGGEVTAHEPGQLVMYPILKLADFHLTPRSYVCLLEEAVISTLRAFGIEGERDAEHPGVWTKSRKVCAIGIRIRARVSMHGIALNILNSLQLFGDIVPCGIAGRGVTTMQHETQAVLVLDEVKAVLQQEMITRLRARNAACTVGPSLHWPVENSIIRS